MNSKLWIRKALTMCLMITVVGTYSMVALANGGTASGELIVTGNASGGDAPFVIVNGEASKTGRTIFSSSTISTSEGTGAIINMGKTGRVELAPNTTVALSFDNSVISGDLTAGSLTVLSAAQGVNLNTPNGTHLTLNAGEKASADPSKAADHKDKNGTCIDDNKDGKLDCDKGGSGFWVWALIFGGATIGIIVAATNHNSTNLGGGTTVISPTR